MVPSVSRKFDDVTVGLYVPPETKEYKHTGWAWFWNRTFHIGAPAGEAVLQMLRLLFAEAYEIPTLPVPPGGPEPDFIIVATIEYVRTGAWFTYAGTPVFSGEIAAKCEVREPDGDVLFTFARSATGSTVETVPEPGEPEAVYWQRFPESIGKKLLSEFADDLTNKCAGKFSEIAAQRTKTVGFLGWICADDVTSVARFVAEQLQKTLQERNYQLTSEESARTALTRQGVSLAKLITDKATIVATARALKCGIVLVGEIRKEGDSLRLRLLKFDGRTGSQTAAVEREVQPDDVKGLISTVEEMVSTLESNAPSP